MAGDVAAVAPASEDAAGDGEFVGGAIGEFELEAGGGVSAGAGADAGVDFQRSGAAAGAVDVGAEGEAEEVLAFDAVAGLGGHVGAFEVAGLDAALVEDLGGGGEGEEKDGEEGGAEEHRRSLW